MARRKRVAPLTVRRDEWEPQEHVVVRGLYSPEVAYINDVAQGGQLRGTYQTYSLIFGIDSWSLQDEMGLGLPWPPIYKTDSIEFDQRGIQGRLKSLAKVFTEDINFLMNKVGEINAPNSKEEQEAFLAMAAKPAGENPSEPTAPTSTPLESAT